MSDPFWGLTPEYKLHTATIPVGQTTVVFDAVAKGKSKGFTASLHSADGTRKIEFSPNDGLDYYTVTPDYTITGGIVFAFLVPVTHVRFTGVAGDVAGIV